MKVRVTHSNEQSETQWSLAAKYGTEKLGKREMEEALILHAEEEEEKKECKFVRRWREESSQYDLYACLYICAKIYK